MTVSVTVLYPPPSLSASRVSQDLARRQHPSSASSLKWFKLQDQDAESCEADLRSVRSSHVVSSHQPYNKKQHEITASHEVFDTSGRPTCNSNTVSFDMTHSVAEIRHVPSASSRVHPSTLWTSLATPTDDCEESIAEYPDNDEPGQPGEPPRLHAQVSR